MAPNTVGLRAAQLQAAARDCVGLVRVIIAASVKLMCKLACTALAALMLAAAAAAAAAGAVGRRASRQAPQPAEQQRLAAVSQLAAEEEQQGEAVPESPLSPPPTPVDLVAAAAAAAAAKQQVSPQTVVELLDPDRPRLLNRIPSGTHRARRAPDIITPSMMRTYSTPSQPATPVIAGARPLPELSPPGAAAALEQPALATALRNRGKALSFS